LFGECAEVEIGYLVWERCAGARWPNGQLGDMKPPLADLKLGGDGGAIVAGRGEGQNIHVSTVHLA
jgi:hypothetical protein